MKLVTSFMICKSIVEFDNAFVDLQIKKWGKIIGRFAVGASDDRLEWVIRASNALLEQEPQSPDVLANADFANAYFGNPYVTSGFGTTTCIQFAELIAKQIPSAVNHSLEASLNLWKDSFNIDMTFEKETILDALSKCSHKGAFRATLAMNFSKVVDCSFIRYTPIVLMRMLTAEVDCMKKFEQRTNSSEKSVARSKPPKKRRIKSHSPADDELKNKWERAKDLGIKKNDFCDDNGITSKELDSAIDRSDYHSGNHRKKK